MALVAIANRVAVKADSVKVSHAAMKARVDSWRVESPVLAPMDDTENPGEIEITNARSSERNTAYTDFLYRRLQRKGYLQRDAQRLQVGGGRRLVQRLLRALESTPVAIEGELTLSVSASIGFANFPLPPHQLRRVLAIDGAALALHLYARSG